MLIRDIIIAKKDGFRGYMLASVWGNSLCSLRLCVSLMIHQEL